MNNVRITQINRTNSNIEKTHQSWGCQICGTFKINNAKIKNVVNLYKKLQ